MFVNPITTLVKIIVSFAFFILGQIFVGASINTIFDYIPRIDRLFAPTPHNVTVPEWKIGDGDLDDVSFDDSVAPSTKISAKGTAAVNEAVAKKKAEAAEKETRDRIINVNAATSLWAAMADKID